MPQTVWLSHGDLKNDRETARGLCKRTAPYEGTLGVGKGKLCPLRGCKELTTEGSERSPRGRETVDNSEDKWLKLETILRRVLREELAVLEKRILEGTGNQISLIGKKANVLFKGGKWIGITAEQRDAWVAAYPSVDLDAELMRAAAWITSNPNFAPKSQYARFINAWLSKEQTRSSIRAIPTRNDPLPGPGRKLCAYCERVASASVSGTWHCSDHGRDAMEGRPPPMMKIAVVAKNVTGER